MTNFLKKFKISDVFQPKLFALIKKRNYTKNDFIADLIAGIIVGIVALPLAIAFGIASGVSPQQGLITAIIAGFLVSFLGGTNTLVGGPTGAFMVGIRHERPDHCHDPGRHYARTNGCIEVGQCHQIHPLPYYCGLYQRHRRGHFFVPN